MKTFIMVCLSLQLGFVGFALQDLGKKLDRIDRHLDRIEDQLRAVKP
jgi:hypothetical protein